MKNPQSICRRVLHPADQRPEIQHLIDAAVGGSYRCTRGGRGRVAEDAWGSRGDEAKSPPSPKVAEGIQQVSSAEKPENNHGGARNTQEHGGAKENFDRRRSPRFTYRRSDAQCLWLNPDARPVRRSDIFRGKTVRDHRGETIFFPVKLTAGGTTVGCTRLRDLPAVILWYVQSMGCVLTERSRGAVSPVMRVRARIVKIPT